ncbi:MAG: arsenite efflux transporter metallochaperone ArsD [Acidobacteriota bacterium]
MIKLQVYDPPMCCSTGVCGPDVDPVLPRFSADFHWLANQGVAVERYNLSQQPQEFVGNPAVKGLLTQEGNACLPLILVNGNIVSKGRYPERDELARFAGVSGPAKAKSLPVPAGGS